MAGLSYFSEDELYYIVLFRASAELGLDKLTLIRGPSY